VPAAPAARVPDGEEAAEEGVELRQSILGYANRHLLVRPDRCRVLLMQNYLRDLALLIEGILA
jgi:hypothetical protein